MASQIFTVAAIGGDAASSVRTLFAKWKKVALKASNETNNAIDDFCQELRAHRKEVPIVYYSEWIDRWLFAQDVSRSGWVSGHRFEACCLSVNQATRRAALLISSQEEAWMANRLKEASKAWRPLIQDAAIVVTREVFGGSTTDNEFVAAVDGGPGWIKATLEDF